MIDKRFRIVQIADAGNYGGAERALQWFASVADRKRFDYHFVFIYRGGPIADVIADMGYPVEVLRWRNGRSVTGRWRLARLLRHLQPDLIHDHGTTPLSRAAMRLTTACPIISTQHSASMSKKTLGRLRLAFSRFDDGLTALVIANSAFTARVHAHVFRRPESAIRIVYLGLNTDRFEDFARTRKSTDRVGLIPNVLRIAFVGRLEIFKGILQLPLLAKALEERGLYGFQILIAGDGPARIQFELLASDLCVTQHFTLLGWQADVLSVFQQVDLLVFPSLVDESFGLVPLEALAAGLPVVGYQAGGCVEALEGAPDTWLVPQGRTNDLADAVITAIRLLPQHDPTAGLAYVRSRFNVYRSAHNVETIYDELLAARR